MTHAYDDIIHLPHPEPKHHPRMSLEARAAQFAPFAALTGHQAVLAEAARYTEQSPGLDDQQCAELNRRVNLLLDRLEEHPMVLFTLFEKDGMKSGVRYREVRVLLPSMMNSSGCLRSVMASAFFYLQLLVLNIFEVSREYAVLYRLMSYTKKFECFTINLKPVDFFILSL